MGKVKKRDQKNQCHQTWKNWLSEWDELAKTLPPATDWEDYSYFLFTLYPHLRPKPVSDPQYRRIGFESGTRIFADSIRKWVDKILANNDTRRVLEDLSRDKQEQVAALVIDSIEELELHERYKDLREQLTTSTREAGSGKVKKLRRTVKKLLSVQHELERHSSSLHPLLAGETLSDIPQLESLIDRMISKIDEVQSPEYLRKATDHLPEMFPFKTKPIDSVQSQLYSFFRCRCGVSGNDAEVRVGLIRNTFLKEWAGPVAVRKSYQDAESQGCDVVRKAVKRFEAAQGKSS